MVASKFKHKLRLFGTLKLASSLTFSIVILTLKMMILLLHELTLLSSILRLAKALILLEMNHASASIILFVLNGNKNENSAFQHVTHLQTTFQWMADLSFCCNHIFCLNYLLLLASLEKTSTRLLAIAPRLIAITILAKKVID